MKCPICKDEMMIFGHATDIHCDIFGNVQMDTDSMNGKVEPDKCWCSNCHIYTDIDYNNNEDIYIEYIIDFITKSFNISQEEVLQKYKTYIKE